MTQIDGLLKEAVRQVVECLVSGRYGDVEQLTGGTRLNALQIAKAITTYGRELIAPPTSAFDNMDVVEVKTATPPRWSVVMPLWTREEGRSDLSIELTVIRLGDAAIVELDDLHVL
jgi:hypothetical protein